MEYWLRSILSWSAPILLDVAVGGDAVQEPAHAVFTISKITFCTKPTVISSFSKTALFQLKPTVFLHKKNFGIAPLFVWCDGFSSIFVLFSREKIKDHLPFLSLST